MPEDESQLNPEDLRNKLEGEVEITLLLKEAGTEWRKKPEASEPFFAWLKKQQEIGDESPNPESKIEFSINLAFAIARIAKAVGDKEAANDSRQQATELIAELAWRHSTHKTNI